jgi:hypothetical protein
MRIGARPLIRDHELRLSYGHGDTFAQSISDFSERYTDQNEHDYQQLLKAVRTGRLQAVEDV